ncbi:MAG: aldo/keto reductase [Candidatus Melainabacteria bacterium]|jgi:aryl-alcohol dehydrogenase-like predicted oxidoreductase|nr:aldo/keto reductase [Candidatus Melainabacteria bacterium]
MKYRDFGNTGIKVSEIGFGCWAIGGNDHGNSYGPTTDKSSTDAINKALELGLNFFDTADVYGWGHSEELLGKALRGKRDRVVIATKVGADFYQGTGFQTFTPDYIRFALEKSLTRLNTDYIDVYQLHNPPLKLISKEETFATLRELKKEGKIRAFGVSVFTPIEGITAINVGQPDCVQITYNIFSCRPEEQLLPRAFETGCAIIAREPLANGFLTGKYDTAPKFASGDFRKTWPMEYVQARSDATRQLSFLKKNGQQSMAQAALKYPLINQAISTVIVGMKDTEMVEENLAASDAGPLSAEEIKQIHELQALGFNLKAST